MNSTEKKIYDLLEECANSLGFDIVKIIVSGSPRKVLDIAIDKIEEGSVTIADCKRASNNFSAILDVEDVIEGKYYLEVGSAGVERPLVKLSDYEKFKNRQITLKLHKALEEQKRFNCTIEKIESENITFKTLESKIFTTEYENIKSAHLVFTEEMFRESLSKS
jgi:ribosome maturation factor RimP